MSAKKVKSAAKIFNSNINDLESIIINAMDRIDNIVGSSLGPGGKNVIIESDLVGLPNKNTKDGVTIFKSLGAVDPYEHLIIEQTRDVAVRTVNEAGDGTTTATIIASALIKNLFKFCRNNRKYSPQRATREIAKSINTKLLPQIRKSSIDISTNNQSLLEKVAKVSANGDEDMAKAVMKAFEEVGFGASSHVTIQELSGPSGKYEAERIEGFPFEKGYEESIGKFHPAFINDQAHQRIILEKPLFILFDGNITDMVQIHSTLNRMAERYVEGDSEYANIVVVAHSFADKVLTNLAYNFANPDTINVVPLATPRDQMVNFQLHFLMDLSAFTGAKIFDISNSLEDAIFRHEVEELDENDNVTNTAVIDGDFGSGMDKVEIYRFRTTISGNPDELNIATRAEEIETLKEQSESKIEQRILDERLGKLTSGIARLNIYGATNGELKEKVDRAEDAVCAVRAAITHGCLPGGGRMLIDLVTFLNEDKDSGVIEKEVLIPSLLSPVHRLFSNAGYTEEEIGEVMIKMLKNPNKVYDIENEKFGTFKKMGIYDATLAVEQALKNASSIASVMGTLGGIVAFPRDNQLETADVRDKIDFQRNLDNAGNMKNEANERA